MITHNKDPDPIPYYIQIEKKYYYNYMTQDINMVSNLTE